MAKAISKKLQGGNEMKRRIALLFIAMITVLSSLAGCSTGDKAKPGKDALREVTVLLDWIPNTNHTGLYAAVEKGYYADEGLDVKIMNPTEGGSADLIAANKAEFGISYQEQVTYARTADNPLPVKAVAAIIQHNTSGFASPVDKSIKTPKDFEGKRYGGFGSLLEEKMLSALMKKNDADFSKLSIVNIGSADFFTSVQKTVDFSWIYYGWDGIAAEMKPFPINFIKLQDLDSRLDFYTPVIIVNEGLIEKDKELIRKFLSATAKGYEYCIENPEEAVNSLLKAAPEIDRELAIASQKYLAGEYKSDVKRWGEMKESTWDNFGSWMYENELKSRKLDAAKAFTNEFLPQ
jgi:ABC-type nitrate/sulfonate/bicarbonate transport system substrate-binding protein